MSKNKNKNLNGVYFTYNDEGVLIMLDTYKNNKRHGYSFQIIPELNAMRILKFEHDELIDTETRVFKIGNISISEVEAFNSLTFESYIEHDALMSK